MKKAVCIALTGLMVFLGTVAVAQENGNQDAAQDIEKTMEQEGEVQKIGAIRGDYLIDAQVVNEQGEEIGDIEDYVITLDGQVPVVVLDYDAGDTDTEGDVMYPIPLKSLAWDTGAEKFAIDQNAIEGAVSMTEDEFYGNGILGGIFEFDEEVLGIEALREAGLTEGQGMRASELTGMLVMDVDGEQSGVVNDFVIDYQRGRVTMVSMQPTLAAGTTVTGAVPIPFEIMKYSPEEEAFIVDVEPEVFIRAPAYTYTSYGLFAPVAAGRAVWGGEMFEYWEEQTGIDIEEEIEPFEEDGDLDIGFGSPAGSPAGVQDVEPGAFDDDPDPLEDGV